MERGRRWTCWSEESIDGGGLSKWGCVHGDGIPCHRVKEEGGVGQVTCTASRGDAWVQGGAKRGLAELGSPGGGGMGTKSSSAYQVFALMPE